MSKTVSELCREVLELREKAPFRFESMKDENRLFADLDPQYFAFDMPESLANHLAFAANHIKQIAERCLELEMYVNGDILSHESCAYKELKEENQKLREALEFYGYTAIVNAESNDKTEQYWNDKGIYDHGAIAREALKGGQGD